MTIAHILIVDDDKGTRDLIRTYIEENHLRVSTAADGKEMHRILEKEDIDLIVLDLMLPGDDGLTLCRKLRNSPKNKSVPIIMLTARGGETDLVVGLEMGADDYMPKPFSARELLARIRSVMRRSRFEPVQEAHREISRYIFANWTLELKTQQLISPQNVLVDLSRGELSLLTVLLSHPNQILSRDQIMEFHQGKEATAFDRSIDVQITRLRKRLKDNSKNPKIIKTVWGKGYILSCEVETE
ncbi:MAG: response regulator [Magnetococcales bacterium]|nr:response regulator [Magnetococcales bacterium]